MSNPCYTVHNARYAKGMRLVRTSDPNASGFKTRAAYLLVALHGRWTNRERGYIVSPTKLAKFEKMFQEGWDGDLLGRLVVPKT